MIIDIFPKIAEASNKIQIESKTITAARKDNRDSS